jgi:hypothetical protein
VVPSFSKDYRYGKPGTKTGSLDVYWNSSLRKNCSIAYAYGPTYGVRMYRYSDIGLYPSHAPDDVSEGYYSLLRRTGLHEDAAGRRPVHQR